MKSRVMFFVVLSLAFAVACGSSKGSNNTASSGGAAPPAKNASAGGSPAAGNFPAAVFKGSGTAQGKRVFLVGQTDENPYIAALHKGFIAEGQKDGMNITKFTNPFDPALQNQQMDQAIAQHADLIALIADDTRAIIPAMKRADAAGIPIVILSGALEPGNENLYISFIGDDQYKLGQVAAQELVQGLHANGRKGGNVMLITGSSGTYAVNQRIAAMQAVFGQAPDIHVVEMQDGKWDQGQSEKIASQLFAKWQSQGGIQGAIGMADQQAWGIILAAQQAGIKVGPSEGELLVVGGNCNPLGLDAISKGLQYATVSQPPAVLGATTADRIADYFNHKPLPHDIVEPNLPMNKDNLAQFKDQCTF